MSVIFRYYFQVWPYSMDLIIISFNITSFPWFLSHLLSFCPWILVRVVVNIKYFLGYDFLYLFWWTWSSVFVNRYKSDCSSISSFRIYILLCDFSQWSHKSEIFRCTFLTVFYLYFVNDRLWYLFSWFWQLRFTWCNPNRSDFLLLTCNL